MPLILDINRGAMAVDDRVANIQPEDWRPAIFNQLPVGRAPMTAMLQSMGSTPTTSRIFHWWEQPFNAQRGDVTDVYNDQLLSDVYVSGGSDGDTLYLKMSAADATLCNVGDTLMVIDADNNLRQGGISAVTLAGASSYISWQLLEDDTSNKLAGTSLTFILSGNAQPELSQLPDAIYQEPVEQSNFAQIFMESIEQSGTSEAEEERVTPLAKARMRAEGLMRLRNKMEWAFMFGVKKSNTGPNGKPRWYTRGIRTAISENESSNILNYKTDSTTVGTSTSIAGKSWLAGGMDWFEEILELLSRYSDNPVKKGYCGSLAWLALNRLVLDHGHYKIEEMEDAFGIRVLRIHGLLQTLDIIQHPLMTAEPAFRKSMLIIEPELLKYRPQRTRDLTFVDEGPKNMDGWVWVDGTKSGWFVQAGLQYDNLAAMAWLDNLGVTNTAS